MIIKMNKLFELFKGQCVMFEKFIVKCRMLRDSKFQVHLSSTKAMFQCMTLPPFKHFRSVEKDHHPVGEIQRRCCLKCLKRRS